jgi:hypothetical protein
MGMVLLLLLSAVASQVSANPASRVYQHSQCSYSFEYPKNWQVVQSPEDVTGKCAVTLRPIDYDKRMAEFDVDVYTLTIDIAETTFLRAAAENGFENSAGGWRVLGRLGSSHEAEVLNQNGWSVLRGIASIGCFAVRGGYSGLCDEFRAIARRQDDDRIVVMRGGTQTEEAFELILKSLKLRSR